FLDKDSVGATEQIMTAACLAEGRTVIINSSIDPDVMELASFLKALGANIRVSRKVIEIEGVRELRGTEYPIAFDRIEAGTFAVFGAITRGDIVIQDVVPSHMMSFLLKMKDAGVGIELTGDEQKSDLRIFMDGRPAPTDIFTSPFPGFPTDLMPAFLTLMSVAEGTSVITDTIFVDRFKFIDELKRLGVNVKRNSEQVCMVTGVTKLAGTDIKSPDLRGGTALIAAALASEGESRIHKTEHIYRGYENLTGKLTGLSAKAEIIEED
ncbi:MAG: UDP-N-acetylglucosamine 1-carboxyvinyltransferase, partial [Abditibacteriota bacterium]|nr:UDP-N-acetylglucosamine 1-carboxyvinyltransferase [Abditibacteriota bacterium]